MKKVCLSVLLMGVLGAGSLSALSLTWGGSTSVYYYGSRLEDDSTLLRSSVAGEASYFTGLGIGNLESRFVMPLTLVSQSPEFAGKRMKEVLELGFGLQEIYWVEDWWGVFLEGTYGLGLYVTQDDEGESGVLRLMAGPILGYDGFEVSAPLGYERRQGVDCVTFGLTVGYGWTSELY